jgi:hypothetical protein
MGGLRAIGGGFEAFAGYTLAAASGAFGVGTSPTGIGAVAGAAGVVGGVALGAHGVDTFQSGIRQMWTGKAVDSITSTGLQAAGMSPQAANLTDAGISVVGSFGAGAATRGLTVAGNNLVRQASSSGPRLVHMTPARNAIEQSGKLGRPSDLYAGPASNANLSGWRLTGKTGLDAGKHYEPIYIPSAAESVFTRPIPVGPFTAWQRAMGTQYAPRGVIDLGTGAFTRTGINQTQALWYTIDAGITTTAASGGYLYLSTTAEDRR